MKQANKNIMLLLRFANRYDYPSERVISEHFQVLDLGFGKIDPDDKHNFCTFDQAAYSVLQNVPSESTCTLKIYLVANEKSGIEEQFLGEGQFPLPVDDKSGTF